MKSLLKILALSLVILLSLTLLTACSKDKESNTTDEEEEELSELEKIAKAAEAAGWYIQILSASDFTDEDNVAWGLVAVSWEEKSEAIEMVCYETVAAAEKAWQDKVDDLHPPHPVYENTGTMIKYVTGDVLYRGEGTYIYYATSQNVLNDFLNYMKTLK